MQGRIVSHPPSTRPSPHGEGESFAVPLKIRAPGFAGTKKAAFVSEGRFEFLVLIYGFGFACGTGGGGGLAWLAAASTIVRALL